MGIDAQILVKVKHKVTPEEALDLAYHLASAFGTDKFWIFRPDKVLEKGCHCLEIIDKYEQDGPTIYPDEGEMFLQVYPRARYYWDDYERGDAPLIIMIAEWLERRIPGCEVWYGGDSSGACARLFDKPCREEMLDHFCHSGHEGYERYFAQRSCDFCNKPVNH